MPAIQATTTVARLFTAQLLMVSIRKKLVLSLIVLAGVLRPGGWLATAARAAEPLAESPSAAVRVEQRHALRSAIQDLAATFGRRYPQAEAFLERLGSVHSVEEIEALSREALTANPLVGGQPILFVSRIQYVNNHGTEATMCQTGEINTNCFRGTAALKVIQFPGGKVTTILAVPEGVVRDPEVSFDGRKVLFSMRRNREDDYHLYEVNVDGSGLRQLTFAARVSDIQPVYMPDGTIVFSSTRDPKYIPCQRHLMANLFRMGGDGSNVHQIGYNTQFEGRASLMPDGRLLYTRWEYVDKHYSSAYGLWTVNPDGTDHALYYGNYAWQPGAIVDARIIPVTGRFVAVFSSVHEMGWGAMVIGDRCRGLDGMAPVVKSWPADIGSFMANWDTEKRIGGEIDSFRRLRLKYEDPYPLSEKHFLCSRQVEPGGRMGLFLVDVFGNEVLLHEESPGCFDPMPIAARARPPVVPPKTDPVQTDGRFYVGDVYAGKFMEQVKPGSIKYLRVVEAPAKRTFPAMGIGDWAPWGSADSHHPVALNWHHYNNKRILGTVPVEEDGSAYFAVPAGKFVYFQLLDENGMMVHSMRSGTMLQPGETKGCTGCHEDHLSPKRPPQYAAAALGRGPLELRPWYGPPRRFSYAAEVQPVLNEHCVACHDHGKEAEELNLCGDKGIVFSVSYTSLLKDSPSEWIRPQPGDTKPLVCSVGAGPVKVLEPYTWGSHRSRLVDLLRRGHYDVRLSRQDFDRIVTWIDLNVPYYPSHVTYYGGNTAGRSPLDHRDLAELGLLVLQSAEGKDYGWSKVNEYTDSQIARIMATHGEPVNFTRPQHSLCLSGFGDRDGATCQRALALIRKGQANLEQHPRCDMPGFRPSAGDQARLDYLDRRRRIEKANRDAIAMDAKRFDENSSPPPGLSNLGKDR